MSKSKRNPQSHGLRSRVYVPIILKLFREKHAEGVTFIDFTLDEIRDAANALNIQTRNAADVVYRMRSRTALPAEILEKGFYVLRQTGRGKYRLEQAENTIFDIPLNEIQDALDLTPLPVRRLLPEVIADIDEQGLLTMMGYCKLLDHFTGLTVYRLRSHVRKSVKSLGQAELDEIDVGVAMREDEVPVIFPIEAKATDESVNRVQIAAMVAFCAEYFAGYEIRPLAVKLDYDSIIHFIEFTPTVEPSHLKIVKSGSYRLRMSPQQQALFQAHRLTPATAMTDAKEIFGSDE